MEPGTRKLLDRAFSGLGVASIALMAASLVVLLAPIVVRGARAYIFRGTIEHRRVLADKFGHGDKAAVAAERAEAVAARQLMYDLIAEFEKSLEGSFLKKRKYGRPLHDLKERLRTLLGPFPDDPEPVLIREQYGQTRWDRAQVKLHDVLFTETYDYSDPTKMGVKVFVPRTKDFEGDAAAEAFAARLFPCVEQHLAEMLRPRWTFYWQFLTDESKDAHIFGGVWPEVLGTLYLTVGAVLFAVPMGVVAAIYLVEYSSEGTIVSVLRTFISTLAGVPSIVFGLFGYAFFIDTLRVSGSKSVLAGSLTLALLILPMVIRAAEEAIRAVPQTYKEAALSLGASRWRTVLTVILPAALPGILTGVVISMGRAAGETAPIIFTAAVSVGRPLSLLQTFTQPTPALPWNIYNLCTEHEAVDEIRHVQFGMVLTLVVLVLLLSISAIWLRARISKKLRG